MAVAKQIRCECCNSGSFMRTEWHFHVRRTNKKNSTEGFSCWTTLFGFTSHWALLNHSAKWQAKARWSSANVAKSQTPVHLNVMDWQIVKSPPKFAFPFKMLSVGSLPDGYMRLIYRIQKAFSSSTELLFMLNHNSELCFTVFFSRCLREQSMASVGFCVVTTAKRGYPLEDATHIALSKTLRKMHTHIHTHSHMNSFLLVRYIRTKQVFYHPVYPVTFFLHTSTHTRTHTLAENCLGN